MDSKIQGDQIKIWRIKSLSCKFPLSQPPDKCAVLSCFSHVRFCGTLLTSPPACLSMGFSKQECWSGLPCPPPGNLPNPRIPWRRAWQGWNLGLLHCRQIPYYLSHQGSLPDKHASSSQKSHHSLLAFLISKPWSRNCLQAESQSNCKTHLVSVLLRIMAKRKPILTPCWKLFLWLAFIIIIIVNGLPRRPCPSVWL